MSKIPLFLAQAANLIPKYSNTIDTLRVTSCHSSMNSRQAFKTNHRLLLQSMALND